MSSGGCVTLIDESFFQETFMPYGYCLECQPDILWLNVISDFFIAAAYFTIPIALFIFLQKRKNIQYRGIFILFALFILFCGISHLMAIYNMWQGAYGLYGVLKALTAIVSLITAYVLFKNLKIALSLPSRKEVDDLVEVATKEKIRAKKLEIEKKGQEIFKFTTELLPSGLLVIDERQNIVMANAALCNLFGYQKDELLGKPLSLLIDHDKAHHTMLVSNYMKNPTQSYQMAAGRVVRGVHKNGRLVDIQINLSVHSYAGEKHTFAIVTDFGSFLSEQEEKNELSNRLNRAIDASDDGIWEWNVQNDHVWYSPQLMKLIGQENKAKPALDDWLDHIHPEDRQRITSAIESHFIDKTKYNLIYRGMASSGNYEWFRTRGDSIFDQNNQPILMSGILSNINQTKKLEDKLAEKSKFLNEVLQRSLTGLYIYDIHRQSMVYINPEFTNLTGYTLSDLDLIQKNEKFESLFHPDDLMHVKQHQETLLTLDHDDGLGIEYRFKHKSGEWKWLYSRESVYSFDDDAQAKELLGAMFDITELKKRELEIRKLALDYSTTFEQAGVGIAHINLAGSFIKANSKFLSIFAYESFNHGTVNFVQLCDPEDRTQLRLLIDQLVESNETTFQVEKRFIRSNGEVFWADLTVSYVKASSVEEPAYFIAVLDDISQRKIMEKRLSESNKSLERFAYAASHDLQEPLRKISAFSGALEHRLKESTNDPEIIFQLDRICDASVRMGKMIDNLLKLSRASSDVLNIKLVSLSSIIVLALDDLSTKVKSVEMSLFLPKDIMISVDSNAFSQVIRNLISNSIVYRNRDRTLQISIESKVHKNYVVLKYQDNGEGFSTDKAEIIFEPFRRLVNKATPGTGMGLTICRQVMKAHQGRIYAQSKEHQGAIFIIEIPIKEQG
jgi:PAS domain S-box-containing protein